MSCNMTKLRDGKSLECATFHFCLLVFNGFFLLLLLDLSETIEQILLHFRLCTVNPGSELIWARLNVFSSWIGKKPVELVLKILSLVICAMWLAHRGTKPNYKSEIWSPCAVMYKEISGQQGQWCVISWWMGICWIAPVDHSKYTEFQKKVKPAANHPEQVNNWWTNSRNAECKEYKWCFYKNFITASPWSFT